MPIVERLVPTAVTLMWVPYVARVAWPVLAIVPLVLICYAVIAVSVHGRLAMDRPPGEHLTRFYLLVSAGGLVATAFVALFAPLVFGDVYEYPLLVLACPVALALLASVAIGSGTRIAGRPTAVSSAMVEAPARPMTRCARLVLMPHTMEPSTNTTIAAMKMRRASKRSASQPLAAIHMETLMR